MTAKSKRKSPSRKKTSRKGQEATNLPSSVEQWFTDNEEDVAAVREHNQTVPFYVPEKVRLLRVPGSRSLGVLEQDGEDEAG